MTRTRVLVDLELVDDIGLITSDNVYYLFTDISMLKLNGSLTNKISTKRPTNNKDTILLGAIDYLTTLNRAEIISVNIDTANNNDLTEQAKQVFTRIAIGNEANNFKIDYILSDDQYLKAINNKILNTKDFKSKFQPNNNLTNDIKHNLKSIANAQQINILYILPFLTIIILFTLIAQKIDISQINRITISSILFGVLSISVSMLLLDLKLLRTPIFGILEIILGTTSTILLYNENLLATDLSLIAIIQLVIGIYLITSGLENARNHLNQKHKQLFNRFLPSKIGNHRNLKKYEINTKN